MFLLEWFRKVWSKLFGTTGSSVTTLQVPRAKSGKSTKADDTSAWCTKVEFPDPARPLPEVSERGCFNTSEFEIAILTYRRGELIKEPNRNHLQRCDRCRKEFFDRKDRMPLQSSA